MNEANPATEPRGNWWMVTVLFALYVLSWVDRLILAMLVTPIKANLLLSDVQVSMVTSTSFAIFYAVFGLPLGWAADRFSRRWIIFLGVTIWALATVACGFATSYGQLLSARIMVGIGEAALLPSAYSLISDAFPRHKLTLATSIFQTAGKIGSALAFGLGGLAIAFATKLGTTDLPIHGPALPWQMVMMTVGIPGFVMGLLIFSFRDPGRRLDAGKVRGQRDRGAAIAFMKANWQLIGLMLIAFSALAICGYSMTNWVPAYIERHFGWKPAQYGAALSLMNIVAAISLVANGWIVDRLFARGMLDAHLRFYSWLIAAVAPVICYMFFASNAYVFLLCYGVAQFITVPFMIYVASVITLLAPNAVRAQMIGLFLMIFTLLGLGAGPAIVAGLTDHLFRDETKLGYALAIVVIGGAAIAWAAMRGSLRYLRPAIERNQSAAAAAAPRRIAGIG